MKMQPTLKCLCTTAFAAGHCYQPFVKYGNLTSSDNTWAVGSVVEFACDTGYTLEQGSVTIECVDPNNPQWNDTEPACRGLYVCQRSDPSAFNFILFKSFFVHLF